MGDELPARTPRAKLGYEPVFQCHPLQCPPVPAGQDPVVACDTDARMDWEWYYMRDITESDTARDVEAAFHKRIRHTSILMVRFGAIPGASMKATSMPSMAKKDRVIHIWGATEGPQEPVRAHIRHGMPNRRSWH